MNNLLSNLTKPSKKTTIICVVFILLSCLDLFITGGSFVGGLLFGLGIGMLIHTKFFWKHLQKEGTENR